MSHLRIIAVLGGLLSASPILAQGIALSGEDHNNAAPIEVVSEELTVDQESGTAVFLGDAKAKQDDLRLAGDKITVFYSEDSSEITRVLAEGDVVFTNGIEVAEGQVGDYNVATNMVKMTGDVLLVQGPNALSGDVLNMDLTINRAKMSGNVRTVLVPPAENE